MFDRDKNCLSYWFPKIEATGLPVPATVVFEADAGKLIEILHGKTESAEDVRLARDMRSLSGNILAPCFLRTGQYSGKHSWGQACYLPDKELETLCEHILRLVEESQLVDFMGLPCDVWVLREMLKTAPRFHAFSGNMPITREFRFFVRDGKIEHVQPYWPQDALLGNVDEAKYPHWREALEEMSRLSVGESNTLRRLTQRASEACPGHWSVDWLETIDRGWVLTDMAVGEQSFKWFLEPMPCG